MAKISVVINLLCDYFRCYNNLLYSNCIANNSQVSFSTSCIIKGPSSRLHWSCEHHKVDPSGSKCMTLTNLTQMLHASKGSAYILIPDMKMVGLLQTAEKQEVHSTNTIFDSSRLYGSIKFKDCNGSHPLTQWKRINSGYSSSYTHTHTNIFDAWVTSHPPKIEFLQGIIVHAH